MSDIEDRVRIKIKETRVGNMGVMFDVSADEETREATEAEENLKAFHTAVLSQIDIEIYANGDVIADILVPEEGMPYIDWNEDIIYQRQVEYNE